MFGKIELFVQLKTIRHKKYHYQINIFQLKTNYLKNLTRELKVGDKHERNSDG